MSRRGFSGCVYDGPLVTFLLWDLFERWLSDSVVKRWLSDFVDDGPIVAFIYGEYPSDGYQILSRTVQLSSYGSASGEAACFGASDTAKNGL